MTQEFIYMSYCCLERENPQTNLGSLHTGVAPEIWKMSTPNWAVLATFPIWEENLWHEMVLWMPEMNHTHRIMPHIL